VQGFARIRCYYPIHEIEKLLPPSASGIMPHLHLAGGHL